MSEWALFGEHAMVGVPKRDLPLGFGRVVYEGDPEVVRAVLSDAPLTARLVMFRLADACSPRTPSGCTAPPHRPGSGCETP